jgi:hypothetical protein
LKSVSPPRKSKFKFIKVQNQNNLAVVVSIAMLAFWGAFFVLVPAEAILYTQFTSVQTSIRVTVCGNNIVEAGEQCDGTDLNGATCSSLGLPGNNLSCRPSCEFNTDNCTVAVNGGGGGGLVVTPPVVTSVTFKGRAYPGSTVTLLKDAQLAVQTVAGPDANFEMSLSGLSGGNYLFSVRGQDNVGRLSSLLTFPISVTAGATTKVSGIFISPTIALSQDTVNHGDNLIIFGQTVPLGDVTIVVNSTSELLGRVTADNSGAYLYNLDTTPLEIGEHNTKSRTIQQGEASNYSKSMAFFVGSAGEEGKINAEKQLQIQADYNQDGKINLIEFSIAAYWYKRPNPPAFIDLNHDGKVDLVDFSILAYYWTG